MYLRMRVHNVLRKITPQPFKRPFVSNQFQFEGDKLIMHLLRGAYKHILTSEDGSFIKVVIYGQRSNVWIASILMYGVSIHRSSDLRQLLTQSSTPMHGQRSDVWIATIPVYGQCSDVWIARVLMYGQHSVVWITSIPMYGYLAFRCMDSPMYGPSNGHRCGCFSGC